jgi:hypothetical protein
MAVARTDLKASAAEGTRRRHTHRVQRMRAYNTF